MSNPESTTPARRSAPEASDAPWLTPPVDIFENDDEYRVVADLPGVSQDEVQLDLERGALTLVARRSGAREGQVLAVGRRQGDFRRVFRIPEEVDAARVEAHFDQGVLEVRLPKAERVKPRRIAINAMA